ncbi:MAG TPA: zf-TFIIB domain-containing protein [Vicinamibacterales bacterium]|nr:zf-TFIIB domain-containing protein [Vicinamibacterales bacterium]
MNCVNCGAAMGLNARGYYVCAHCGTTSFPEAVSRDGIRILGPGDSEVRCSSCDAPFLRGMLDDYLVDYCEKCRGLLLSRRDFAEVVRRRRAWAQGQSVPPTHTDGAELRRRIKCPKCGTRMMTDWYYGPGNVVLDRCVACDLVWLDYGELKQIVDAPGEDRGSRDLT